MQVGTVCTREVFTVGGKESLAHAVRGMDSLHVGAAVVVDDRAGVKRFSEKPQVDGWASAGYFVFNRKIFDYLTGDDCVLERDPLEQLAKEKQLMAYRHDGFFFAMDTYREYLQLNELWSSGNAPWKVWK